MTQTTECTVAREIIAEFKIFEQAYRQYLDRVDELALSLKYPSEFNKEAQMLLGTKGGVSTYFKGGKGIIDRLDNLVQLAEEEG